MCAHVDLQASAIWILTQTDAPACSLVISLVLPSCWGDGGGRLISSLSGLRGHLLCTYTANTTGCSYVRISFMLLHTFWMQARSC